MGAMALYIKNGFVFDFLPKIKARKASLRYHRTVYNQS